MKPGRKSAAEVEASVVKLASNAPRPRPTPPEILSTAEQSLFAELGREQAPDRHRRADADRLLSGNYQDAPAGTQWQGCRLGAGVEDHDGVGHEVEVVAAIRSPRGQDRRRRRHLKTA